MDVEAELRGAQLSRVHIRLSLVLGAVLFIDGYDLFNAAYVAPYVKREWGLADHQIGLLFSIGIAGLATGAIIQASIVRAIGRRTTVALATALLAIASLALSLFAQGFLSFVALRFVLGMSLGMLSPLAFVYVNEWAPANCANRFATLSFVLPFSLGGIAAGLAAITLGPTFGWRSLYLVAGVGLPIAIASYFLLPESFVRLLQQGRTDEVRAYLTAARPDRAQIYATRSDFMLPAPTGQSPGIRALFSKDYRFKTIGIWIASAFSLLSLHGVSAWLPTMLIASGQAFTTAFGYGTLLMTMQVFGGAILSVFADRHGRTAVMACGFVGCALAMWAMAAALGSSWLAFAVAAAGFFIFGTQAVMNNFTALAYPPALRATGTGAAVAFSRVGGISGPLLIGWTLSLDGGLWSTFALLATAQLLAAATVFALHRHSLSHRSKRR